MRGFQAAALLGLLVLPAKADIVDSGSLQIGGQGIIGGTMTVQGNALGVAGSISATSATLSGTGSQAYSLTTSSGIHIINGKLKLDAGAMIEWADLSKSTTASGGAAASGWVVVQTVSMSGSTSAALAITADGSTYKVVVALRQTTSYGDMFLRFNNDSGGNYNTETQYAFSTGSASMDSGVSAGAVPFLVEIRKA